MAWCGPCQRYLTPAALTAEGVCPSCGAEVEHPDRRAPAEAGRAGESPSEAEVERLPWHFWLLLAAAAVYLGWRAVQGVALLLTAGVAAALS